MKLSLLRLSLLLGAFSLFGCPQAPLPDPLEPAPRIVSFIGSAAELAIGDQVTLTWAVENATELRIDELKLGSISGVSGATGSVAVAITENALFVLTARNKRGASDSAVVAVRVREGGRTGTVLFTALPQRIEYGETATLAWSAPGARTVSLTADPGGDIDLGLQVTSGSVAVRPTESTTYTLTVDGRVSTATVAVAPAILSFTGGTILSMVDAGVMDAGTADAGTADAGLPPQRVTLRWQTSGASRAVLTAPGRGTLLDTSTAAEVADGTFVDTLPGSLDQSALFSYLLSVTGGGTTVTRELVLSVSGTPAVLTFTAPKLVKASTDGGTMLFQWTTSQADELSIMANGTEIFRAPTSAVSAGTARIPVPAVDTTYVAVARASRGGSASRSVVVDVVDVPTVTLLASPSSAMAGQAVMMSWSGEHIREVRLGFADAGAFYSAEGDLDMGSTVVALARSASLELEVSNGLGDTARATAAVTIANPFTFTQSPAGTLRAGQDVQLAWTLGGEVSGFAHREVLERNNSTGFDDISQTGTRINFPGTSNQVAFFEPAFRMPFFDRVVGERVWVTNNGVLSFASWLNPTNTTTAAFPNGRIEPYSIAGNWGSTSLLTTSAIYWQVKPTATGQVLIVQWTNIGSSTWQVKLYSSGQVDLEYLTFGGSGQAGIQGPRSDWGFALPSARAANKGFTFFGPVPSPLTTVVRYERPLFGTVVLGNREMLVQHDPGVVVRPNELSVAEALLLPASSVGPQGRWLELFNNKDTAVDLSGWAVTLPDGGTFALSGTVPPAGSYVVGATVDRELNDDAGVQLALPGFEAFPLSATPLTLGRSGTLDSYAIGSPDAGVAQVRDIGPYRFSSETSGPARAQTCAATQTFGFQLPSQRGTPGADSTCGFGYRVREIQPGFFDISSTGTKGVVVDWDADYFTVSLTPAPFPWFGVPQTALRVSTNGFITFDMTSTSNPDFPTASPSTTDINNVIAPYWGDLEGFWVDSEMYWQRVGPNVDPFASAPHWIIQWHNWSWWTSGLVGDLLFFQVKLFDDGTIEFHYDRMESGNSSQRGSGLNATSGIENAAGTQALIINTQSLTPGIQPNTAFRFSPR